MAGQAVIPASELLRIRSTLLEQPGAVGDGGKAALELHEKSKKRASLTPTEETVQVNRDAGPIELPDVDALEAENERRRAEERAAREAEAAAEAAAEAEAQAQAEAVEAEADAQEPAEEAQESAEAEETKTTGTVRRRRASAS